MIACWEDDPGDPKLQPPLMPITVPAPKQAAAPLAFKLGGTAPAAKIYPSGTTSFRFYATAAALRRTADFWAKVLPANTSWQVGKTLPVNVDSGVDLNAFYTRGDFNDAPGLHFFHATVGARTFFSGESPDICCHEMGHAVLDALRPQLFDAMTIEAAAFHESFGDMSAMLSALQVPSFRQEVVGETAGVLNHTSRLSRLAEQLGGAIRMRRPDSVDPDCLRNACNSFFYRDPQTLPPSAPASALSSEPHSFSRVFTGAFLDILAGMFRLRAVGIADDLLIVSQQMGALLVGAISTAPVVPDYYSQVAAHMIAVSQTAPFDGKYKELIRTAFVRRGILSLQAAATVDSVPAQVFPKFAMTATAGNARSLSSSKKAADPLSLPRASISAAGYGLKSPSILVHTAEDAKRFAITSSSLTLGALEPRSAQNAAESFVEDLFQRGRVNAQQHADVPGRQATQFAFQTHIVTDEDGSLILKRRAFDCGFDS